MSMIGKWQTWFNRVAENIATSCEVPPMVMKPKLVNALTGGVKLSEKASAVNTGVGLGVLFGAAAFSTHNGDFAFAGMMATAGVGIGAYHNKRGAKIIAEQANKNDSLEQTNNLG